jgi:high-affinity nickel-transport protein
LIGVLIAVNVAAWSWAVVLFHTKPALLGIALLAWGLGLRHAVDADHIAAIDNVTRKLMNEGKRSSTVGLWFAIGHSTIVLIAAAAVAYTTTAIGRFESLRAVGGVAATSISAAFLFAIAAMNLLILRSVWKRVVRMRATGVYVEDDVAGLFSNRGIAARLFRPLFRLVSESWHMAPLGFLFGFGFDTATEVAILGISVSQAANGIAIGTIVALPALFAAGMTLIDTLDGVLMLGAYEWAYIKPIRKLYYNVSITLVSALVAMLVGGIEAIALIAKQLDFNGGLWSIAAALGDRFNSLGFGIIALFIACWVISYALYRWKRIDEIDLRSSISPEERSASGFY